MLLCDQKNFYVGITSVLAERIREHKNKDSFFTKIFSDIKLAYCEQYSDKYKAAKREKQLKGWSNAKKQLFVQKKLGINSCTEFAEALLRRENLW